MTDLRTSTLAKDWTCEAHYWVPISWVRDQCRKCGRMRQAPELQPGYDMDAVRRSYSNLT